jgi:2,5-dioxopentanoate dehydrogenase
MEILGKNILGFSSSSEGTVGMQAINPATGETLGPLFYKATQAELNIAVAKAKTAFDIYKNISGQSKAVFLEAIATEIENLGETLLNRYMAESALPAGRAAGERGRTMGQLRMFANLLKEGSWLHATIDPAMPDRQPLPRPDLRSMERALGPVVVFGASNFPLAFSVAGGDTAAALAAGCTVVFKAHPSHMGTSDLVAQAIQKAAKDTGMPDGVFSMLYDDTVEIGQALVKHPDIKAVAFTGSYRGGKAIFDTAMQRPEPIPVYAEMGSTNPVFILPNAVKANGETLAQNYLNSVTLGVGQFCTNPGLMFYESDTAFKDLLTQKAAAAIGGVMLNKGIKAAYDKGVSYFTSQANVLNTGSIPEGQNVAQPILFHTDYAHFSANTDLAEEVFGPSSVVVEASHRADIIAAANALGGHLTATIIGSEEELTSYSDLIDILSQKVGRLLFNGFPTGVEVSHAMVHGGPFPATTDARTTSVGTQAITRFTRPVCFQDMPDALLPAALRNSNPLNIWRKVDGVMGK